MLGWVYMLGQDRRRYSLPILRPMAPSILIRRMNQCYRSRAAPLTYVSKNRIERAIAVPKFTEMLWLSSA